MKSLSTYPFPIFFEEWGLDRADIATAWDNKGDIVIGNDVWIGYEAIFLSGVTIGDSAIIGARAVVTKTFRRIPLSVEYPQKKSKNWYDPEAIDRLRRDFVLVGLAG